MPFTLEELLPDDQRLRTVQLHESVQHVLNMMHQHDYDQLPVVDSDEKTSLKQVVTFDGIIQAIQSFGTKLDLLQVRDVARGVRTYAADADLLATLDDIQRDNFALIVNESNLLTGIVTTADTTVFFREYAQDLMQIEGIESRMKEAIQALYADDGLCLKAAIEAVTDRAADTRKRLPAAIKAYLGKAGISIPAAGDAEAVIEAEKKLALPEADKQFEDLSFDEFTHVLLRHPNAPKLSQSKDVAELRALLERVRNARNKLAHFRGELTSEERRTIQFAAEWLERNLPIPLPEPPSPPPTIAATPTDEIAPPEEEEDDEMPHGSYALLAGFLDKRPDGANEVRLTFREIEAILGKELPRSAFEYRAWWANDPSKPQSTAWLDEGWRTTSLNMTERRLTFVRTSDREDSYIKFFAELNVRLEREASFPLRRISPQGHNWMILASLEWSGPEAANINAAFTRRRLFRVELYLDCGDKDANKKRFDELIAKKAAIEAVVGEPLQWERLEKKRACRVAAYTKAQVLTDSSNTSLLEWATRKSLDFYRAFSPEFPTSHSK